MERDWGSLEQMAASGAMDCAWARVLTPVSSELESLAAFLAQEEGAARGFLPPEPSILRAFRAPFDEVRVLILGQDPYPTPGHSVGLAFAVERHVRPVPRSLANIYRELSDDLGIAPAPHGDLTPWAEQGVLLLNRVLTVRPGETGSHRGQGWERVTACAIEALVARQQPLVAVLWGKDAASVGPALGGVARVESPHPSPLSARRGFFGSRPFSRVNDLLIGQGSQPIDWALPS